MSSASSEASTSADLVVQGDTALIRMNDDSAFFAVVNEKK
jgi:hypothetical protein